MSRAWTYGDNVNTDVLYPGRHLANIDPKYQAAHALEDLDPGFAKTVQAGDVVVGGKFFGCGSSREQAVTCLKYAGVPFVIAASFARIYYRNAINNGLPPLVSPEASAKIQSGDDVTVDLEAGLIRNRTRNETYRFEAFPEFLQRLLAAGGLIPYLRQQVLVKQ
ncbi:MAG: 3-isopropylmalate dehydratase small subunit [Euryarchaeota archaeon]|nr:3-isopropylmalate dehydratase small subunit [Euryarchaeota archaeon]